MTMNGKRVVKMKIISDKYICSKEGRLESLIQSPCHRCGMDEECAKKCEKNRGFYTIVDSVYGKKNYDYRECPLYIALTAK